MMTFTKHQMPIQILTNVFAISADWTVHNYEESF